MKILSVEIYVQQLLGAMKLFYCAMVMGGWDCEINRLGHVAELLPGAAGKIILFYY